MSVLDPRETELTGKEPREELWFSREARRCMAELVGRCLRPVDIGSHKACERLGLRAVREVGKCHPEAVETAIKRWMLRARYSSVRRKPYLSQDGDVALVESSKPVWVRGNWSIDRDGLDAGRQTPSRRPLSLSDRAADHDFILVLCRNSLLATSDVLGDDSRGFHRLSS